MGFSAKMEEGQSEEDRWYLLSCCGVLVQVCTHLRREAVPVIVESA